MDRRRQECLKLFSTAFHGGKEAAVKIASLKSATDGGF
jgi:hypothetical protein